MKAVVAKGAYQIVLEERPKPTIKDPKDAVLKVTSTGLCGSDLHIYHGAMPFPSWDFIVGHEVVGIVDQVGSEVKNCKVGDRVVSSFTTSCRDCFYCNRGLTCRCQDSSTFGTPGLDGVQSEYARIPLADGTLFYAPPSIKDRHLILLADIFPTVCAAYPQMGYSAAKYGWTYLPEEAKKYDTTVAVLGCGPVGLCAVLSARERFTTVFAIDSIPDRLAQAEKYGAVPVDLNNDVIETIKARTEDRGPDAVLEIVGSSDALELAIDLVRVGGVVSSSGLHHKQLKLSGMKLYLKNVSFKFGRTSVIDLYVECLELVEKLIKTGELDDFVHHTVPLDKAVEYYDLFDKRKIGKTIFTIEEESG